MHFTLRKPMVKQGSKLVPIKASLAGADTALPPANCLLPDFDDAGWPTWQPTAGRRRGAEYGYICSKAPGPFLRVMCLRGRFHVADPAGGGTMKLSLAYRGGAAVFLNGKEIARGNLAAATRAISYDFAEDYPADAFVTDKGRPIRWGFGENGKFKAGLAKRIRRLDNVAIPRSVLRKGSNVLVVVLHGTAYYKNDAASGFNNRNNSYFIGTVESGTKSYLGVYNRAQIFRLIAVDVGFGVALCMSYKAFMPYQPGGVICGANCGP